MAISHLHKQLLGCALSFVGLAVTVAVVSQAQRLFGAMAPAADDTATRLAFALHWLLVPGLTLLIGVIVASRRGFYQDAIDGTRTPASHALEIGLRYNQNTLEQTVLAAIAWTGLALALPHAWLVLVPGMAVLFAVGRATFWVGYLIYPIDRAFGMVLTIVPTLGAYGWLAWRAMHG